MKATGFFALAASLTLVLSGCDAVRASLGKPTSKDIAALRAQAAQMQRTADSLAVEMEAAPADTMDAMDAVAESVASDTLGAVAANFAAIPEEAPQTSDAAEGEEPAAEAAPEGLADGFYAVIGSFKNENNARYLYNSISASGTPVELVKMKNGFTAVMICHSDSYDETYRRMLKFYKNEKCPEGIWIYNTAKQLHLEQQ